MCGCYIIPDGTLQRFRPVTVPTTAELSKLTQTIAERLGRLLQGQGLRERDAENCHLTGDGLETGPMDQLIGHAITYRIPNGNIRYQLKTPYGDGTTHVIFEPLDFIARLAALVPKHRVNLTRFHGVFAPNSRDRAAVTPGKRGKGAKPAGLEEEQEKTPAQRRAAMSLNAAPQTRLRHRHRPGAGCG
jgi:hypothetical protein